MTNLFERLMTAKAKAESGKEGTKHSRETKRGLQPDEAVDSTSNQTIDCNDPSDEKIVLDITEDEVTQRFEKQESFHKVITASSIHIGTRKVQQDACYVTSTTSFWGGEYQVNTIGIVCDGIGGLENGAEASQLVVDTLLGDIASAGQVDNPPDFFKKEIKKLDQLVVSRFGSNQAGTTLALAVLSGDHLYWCSVGDSRIYIISEDMILQITKDHNYQYMLDEQVRNGLITPEEAINDPQKESLVSFIGMGGVDIFDISNNPFKIKNGDTVLICSDGLSKSLEDSQIKEIIKENFGFVEEAARLLPIVAFDTGGTKDNTSVVLIQYLE
ncbi:MAG: protein phosphatase 2C domain-containing protein [Coriobacteriia bacterium]|nr:protein phosphatase 2C domain-containing protein [Coriobacteriia bacterium]